MQPWDLAQSYRFPAGAAGSSGESSPNSHRTNCTVAVHWKPAASPAGVALTRIEWSWKRFRPDPGTFEPVLLPEAVCGLIARIEEYFEHGRSIGDVPWELLDQSGWTEFQRKVFKAIVHIPHGETRTYGWVAMRTGNGQASRAVGQALRNNPFPILIPCHRVVATQSIGGFMGSDDPNQPELCLKRSLIRHEESYANPVFDFLNQSAAFFLNESAPLAVGAV